MKPFRRMPHLLAALALLSLPVSFRSVFAQKSEATSSPVQLQEADEETHRLPRHFADGSDLPNGWRITPAGKNIGTIGIDINICRLT